MKHILLPAESGTVRYYRANLHCHTLLSDACKTPEEVKRDYKARGYSVVAYTDHDIFIPHNELTDEHFLALNGYEMEINQESEPVSVRAKTCHICLIAEDPAMDVPVCFHRSKYYISHAKDNAVLVHNDPDEPDYERSYTPECINDMIRRGREAGFFVSYNHPTWSRESYPEYMAYHGMNAMEIYNYDCVSAGYEDDNGRCYDDMLNGGERIFCTATDDNHNARPDDDPLCDSYGGCVMIAADALRYDAVIDSLKKGLFYSAAGNYKHPGPEILSLEYEDGCVRIKTSPARTISFLQDVRKCFNVRAKEGETVQEAEFRIHPNARWFRLTVEDAYGFKAYTNAYFIDTLK